MSFLPQDYKSPNTSNFYLKLQEGENRIRIMSRPIMGWEDWDQNNKPVRYQMDQKPSKPIVADKQIRHFWSVIVFNYNEEEVQIMHITQNSIRKAIEALCRDKDWGDPFGYDIKITKSGKGMETEYLVNPVPHKPMDEYLVLQFRSHPCNLEALFSGADPFSTEWSTYTPLGTEMVSEAPSVKTVNFTVPAKKYISQAEAAALELLITECDPLKHATIREFLSKSCEGTRDLTKMDRSMYESMTKIISNSRNAYQETLKVIDEVPF